MYRTTIKIGGGERGRSRRRRETRRKRGREDRAKITGGRGRRLGKGGG